MLIIIISRSSLKLDHVGSKTRLLGQQATQVSDLGPLWPSCFIFNCERFYNLGQERFNKISPICQPALNIHRFSSEQLTDFEN